MEPSVIVAVLALISSLGGIVVANRYTARTARAAQETTAEIERKKLDASSWQEAIKMWKDDVRQLRDLRNEDKHEHEVEQAKLLGRLNQVEEELKLARRERAYDRVQIDAMTAWGKVVVSMMRAAGIAFPPPPPLISTDPHGFNPVER